jgi:hypothetical protein
MCIRDRHKTCEELWLQLEDKDRQDFFTAYNARTPPAHFFFNVLVLDQEQELKNDSARGAYVSSDSSNSSRTSYTI